LRTRQALPYLAALLLLAWILGTLARSGTGGAGILANSYWLVYLAYLIPILALVAIVAITIFLIINWKLLSDVLGFGIAAHKRQARKQYSTIRLVVWIGFWFIALGTLFWRCGGLFCRPENSTQVLPNLVENIVDAGKGPTLPSLSFLSAPISGLADIVSSPLFTISFLGLLLVSSLIIARSVKVSLDETRLGRVLPEHVREEGTMAVRDALKLLEANETGDPKTRIMLCYERMIKAAASLGARVTVDRTARELEKGIREMFQLQGPGIATLTQLFEEVRYSLHEMTGNDSDLAQKCLLEIGRELEAGATFDTIDKTSAPN